ncbi:MAG: PspC domain-containing protein [Bacteroidales bacterium]|nr:PspC domain-containing protein [Bacteroidales bacterium]
MKKTIKINLSGIIFHIDDDAYEKLKNYLNAINNQFQHLEDGPEIIEDIESRIAEIFHTKLSDQKQVINQEDVVEMIATMGKPEDYINGDDYHEEAAGERAAGYRAHKRLYRNPDDAVLGGVCGGLGTYFNIDPVWIRIIFLLLLLAGGVTLLVYIILWIVIPKAETPSQKLEMRGERITVENIEKSVKKEYEKVKDNLKKVKDTKGYRRTRDTTNDIIRGLGSILTVFLKIILMIIGIALIITGFTAILAFAGFFFFEHTVLLPSLFDMEIFYFPDFLHIFTDPGNVSFFMITLVLTICIPLLALMYGGIKLIFRFKANDKIIGLTAFVLWLLSVISLFALTFFESVNYADDARITKTHQVIGLPSDTLYLQLSGNYREVDWRNEIYLEIDDFEVYLDREEDKLYGRPRLDIVKNTTDEIQLEIEKRSQGRTPRFAAQNARSLIYKWEQRDSLLLFDPYFSLPENERWRAPEVRLKIKLPVGKVVDLDEDMVEIIYDIDNTTDIYDSDMAGKKWIMKEEGLTLFILEIH